VRGRWGRRALKAAGIAAALYALGLLGLFVLMRQQPMVVARGLSRVPGPVFAVTPMETLWCAAREGRLRVGDAAPDFTLKTLDGQSAVRLSEWRGGRPVVLVFGSYT
jgi:hypothetical protein